MIFKEKNKKTAVDYFEAGKQFQKEGKFSEAMIYYRQAIELNPNFYKSYNQLGQVLFKQGLLQDAVNAYIKAVQIKPDAHNTYFNLGEVFCKQGRFDESIDYYLKSIEIKSDFNPSYMRLQFVINHINWNSAQIDKLIDSYKQVIHITPNFIQAYVNLARLLTKQDLLDEAISYYQAASYRQTLSYYPNINKNLFNSKTKQTPNFIIIGTEKGGTTSLYEYICKHPQVIPSIEKEIHFFTQNFQKGINWYSAHFPYIFNDGNYITGEASPSYLDYVGTAKKVFEFIPEVKLIIILRNPVNRAISRYYHSLRQGLESSSFEEAINPEIQAIQQASDPFLLIQNHEFRKSRYILYGLYVYLLKSWMTMFPKEQILILKSEDLYNVPVEVMKQVFSFLGLSNYQLADYSKHNTGFYEPINELIKHQLSIFFNPYNQMLEEYLEKKINW